MNDKLLSTIILLPDNALHLVLVTLTTFAVESQSSFFTALFDFSFRELITTKIIRVLYILVVAIAGFIALFVVFGGLIAGGSQAIMAIVLAPLLFLLYVIIARVYLELVIVIFRIAEDASVIARRESPLDRPPNLM